MWVVNLLTDVGVHVRWGWGLEDKEPYEYMVQEHTSRCILFFPSISFYNINVYGSLLCFISFPTSKDARRQDTVALWDRLDSRLELNSLPVGLWVLQRRLGVSARSCRNTPDLYS